MFDPERDRLTVALCRLHDGQPLQARGTARIEGDPGLLARLLRRLAGLPEPVAACELALEIVPSPRGIAWRRRFGEFAFDTWQRPAGARSVRERVGATDLCFDLRTDEGAVIYEHRSTALCVGPLRVPFPSGLGPRVRCRESPGSHPGRVRFDIRASWLGRTVSRYVGELELLESGEGVGR